MARWEELLHRVYRGPGFLSSRPNWSPPPLTYKLDDVTGLPFSLYIASLGLLSGSAQNNTKVLSVPVKTKLSKWLSGRRITPSSKRFTILGKQNRSFIHNVPIINKMIFKEFFYVLYSTLLHLPPFRFHLVGRCWNQTQDCFDRGIGSQTLKTTRIDLAELWMRSSRAWIRSSRAWMRSSPAWTRSNRAWMRDIVELGWDLAEWGGFSHNWSRSVPWLNLSWVF